MLADRDSIRLRVIVLSVFVGLMWIVRAIDTLIPNQMSSAGMGIVPRTMAGLYNIPISTFIHADWDHLISNTIPLLILGALILTVLDSLLTILNASQAVRQIIYGLIVLALAAIYARATAGGD